MASERPSLAILGSYPPPYGGAAVHVQRLTTLLDDRGVNYRIYNATSRVADGRRIVSVFDARRTWMMRYLFTCQEPAVYVLSGKLRAWVIAALLARCRDKRVVLRLRNASLPDWIAHSWWRRLWCGFALRSMSGVVCVNRRLMESARSLGVDPKRLHFSPGFLPPGENAGDRRGVAPAVWTFADAHRPLIAANGKVNWYAGQDLYGLDHLVELAARLKPDYPELGIVVCFWYHRPEEQSYVDDLMARATDLGVENNILFNTQSGLFVPVIAASDVFVRPTNTDGDASSIREALHLGVPAVASDVVERPEGTILFRTREIDDFEAKVRAALNAAHHSGRPEPKLSPEDRARIDAYVELLAALGAGDDAVFSGAKAGRP